MNPFVAIDLSQLAAPPISNTPRGLDRVSYFYAKHFLEKWPGDCCGMVSTPWGPRLFDRRSCMAFLRYVEELWRDHSTSNDSDLVHILIAGFKGEAPRREARSLRAPNYLRWLSNMRHGLGQSVLHRLPSRAIYLDVGQRTLIKQDTVAWLAQRPDVVGVFMVHDTIPLDYPEFVGRLETCNHRQMLLNLALYARGLIFATQDVREAVLARLSPTRSVDTPTLTLGLPIAKEFRQPVARTTMEDLQSLDYFVACGSLDPRKNYQLLLNVWRNLVKRHGQRAPRLVLAGWSPPGNAVVRFLGKSDLLVGKVIHIEGLPTPDLARLMQGARAILMPSLAEGFGLPIAEALALGRPVLASDLSAHREVGGQFATYIDPLDGPGWLTAIEKIGLSDEAMKDAEVKARGFQPNTEERYFHAVEAFLGDLGRHSSGHMR